MRAARLRRRCLVRDMTVLLSAGRLRPSLGRIREGVVEGVEGAVGRDRELEAISDPGVLDREGERVLVWVPEQEDVDAVALAGGELAGLRCCGAHGSSFSFGRGEWARGHGISTSLTAVAVGRSA